MHLHWAAALAAAYAPLAVASLLPNTQLPLHQSSSHNKKLSLTHDLIGFHKGLVEIESITGNEKNVGHWLADNLESQGYTVEKQYISHDPERFNVLAWPGDVRDASVILTSHIDTVPPFIPYNITSYSKSNTTISGRGSVDAKASVAAQVIAANNLLSSSKISPDSISLLYVIGEETGGDGMKHANSLSLHPKNIIFGEPTERKLISGHKGNMRIRIMAKGRAAHSGYPWLGLSANEVLITALTPIISLGDSLPKSKKYGKTTFNIGQITGGVAANVVAESASAEILVRIASGSPDLIAHAVRKAVYKAVEPFLKNSDTKQKLKPEDVVEVITPGEAYGVVDIDHDIPGFEVMPVNYGTDIPNWEISREGQKRYLYGPGTIFVAHSDHEALAVEDLEAAVEGYERIVLHVLGKEEK